MPKVIWEEGRVAALSHTYTVKFPLVTMARPKFAPKSTPSRGPIPKPHYLPHPWTRPTYGAKRHPDPTRRFSTMNWADRRRCIRTHVRTDGPTDRPRESLIAIGRCATRATRPNNTKSSISDILEEDNLQHINAPDFNPAALWLVHTADATSRQDSFVSSALAV